MNPPNTIRRAANVTLIIAFLALIWLPTLDWRWNMDPCPTANENRKTADFPKNIIAPGPYLEAFGKFFEDHFGFRNQLVHWNTHWKGTMFHEASVNGAMQGEHGWLYWSRERMVENYTGQAQLNRENLQGWQKLLEARRDWLATRGEKYIFVVAPNKETIYPEYLPKWLVKNGRPVKLDQFLTYMRAHSTVPILDLRPCLIAAKAQGATYLQTDTHWNNFGAFVAYQELINALQKQMPALKPLSLESFARVPTVSHGGDLAVCLQQEYDLPETLGVAFHPQKPLQPLKTRYTRDNNNQRIVTLNSNKTGKAILFHDSFAESWVAFIGYHFNQVIYRHQREWDRDMLEREKPDLVIDEMVERTFNNEGPLTLMEADQQPATNKVPPSPPKPTPPPLVRSTGPNRPAAIQ